MGFVEVVVLLLLENLQNCYVCFGEKSLKICFFSPYMLQFLLLNRKMLWFVYLLRSYQKPLKPPQSTPSHPRGPNTKTKKVYSLGCF